MAAMNSSAALLGTVTKLSKELPVEFEIDAQHLRDTEDKLPMWNGVKGVVGDVLPELNRLLGMAAGAEPPSSLSINPTSSRKWSDSSKATRKRAYSPDEVLAISSTIFITRSAFERHLASSGATSHWSERGGSLMRSTEEHERPNLVILNQSR